MSLKYIETAWEGYLAIVVPEDASEAQITDTRQAFYGGAAVLLQALMKVMDPGEEPADADMRVMESIQAEIQEFGLELDLRLLPVGGHS